MTKKLTQEQLEKKRMRQREYYHNNKDKIRAIKNAWRERNREKVLEYSKEYQKKRWQAVRALKWMPPIRKQDDEKISQYYKKHNSKRYIRNKETWKHKEIISRQNQWIKSQYALLKK